mmetsp:Transcript_6348/g.10386  ORF Transcript_6348/g.10386 Transcript_6348/m.10386 type:complete len:231 (+) Transcript_6348:1646-2338(+)
MTYFLGYNIIPSRIPLTILSTTVATFISAGPMFITSRAPTLNEKSMNGFSMKQNDIAPNPGYTGTNGVSSMRRIAENLKFVISRLRGNDFRPTSIVISGFPAHLMSRSSLTKFSSVCWKRIPANFIAVEPRVNFVKSSELNPGGLLASIKGCNQSIMYFSVAMDSFGHKVCRREFNQARRSTSECLTHAGSSPMTCLRILGSSTIPMATPRSCRSFFVDKYENIPNAIGM